MKFSHNNATHLDISKYIQCVCVKVIFVEIIRYLFVSHSYSTMCVWCVCTYGVCTHWSVNYAANANTRCFLRNFLCSFKSLSKRKNNTTQHNNFIKPTVNGIDESLFHLIFIRQIHLIYICWCSVRWYSSCSFV